MKRKLAHLLMLVLMGLVVRPHIRPVVAPRTLVLQGSLGAVTRPTPILCCVVESFDMADQDW